MTEQRPLTWFEEEVLKLVQSEPNCGICTDGIFNSTIHIVRELPMIVDAVKELIRRNVIHFRYHESFQNVMYLPGPADEDSLSHDFLMQAIELGRKAATAMYKRDDSLAAFHRESLKKIKNVTNAGHRYVLDTAFSDAYRIEYLSRSPASRPN